MLIQGGQLGYFQGGQSTLVHSIFSRRDFQVDPSLVFVAMPFSAEFDATYEAIESLLVEHCHLKCLRADNVFRNGSITARIWRHINEAMLIIADLSGRNANVFYEVGIAHALGRPVVLLSRDIDDVPFDLRDLMIVEYNRDTGIKPVRSKLLDAIRACVATVPERWTRPHAGQATSNSFVRISGLQQPERVSAGQPLEIIIRARNEDNTAREGYLSVSFPEAVEDHDVSIIQTDAQPQVGRVKQSWCSGRVILEYPMAEISSVPWEPGIEHFMKVQVRSRRRGWLSYYVSASSRDASGQWVYDPGPGVPHIDQRGEHVLCGIIEIM